MAQNAPDPGGSASLYQYFLILLDWLGLGRPGWASWLLAVVVVTGLLLSLAPAVRVVAVLVRRFRGWWWGGRREEMTRLIAERTDLLPRPAVQPPALPGLPDRAEPVRATAESTPSTIDIRPPRP